MSRMFKEVTRTWNPFIGCRHGCRYCYARFLALGRLKKTARYRDGFEPRLVESELCRRFKTGMIFVSDMGDLWSWGTREDIERILEVVRNSPNARFLFLTKSPERYHEFLGIMPKNVVLGATIESDNDHGVCSLQFPTVNPELRYQAMRDHDLDNFAKFISIEPIMQMDDFREFVYWMANIRPSFVYVGYDNHKNKLLEPALEVTQSLIKALDIFTTVRTKTIREAWHVTENSLH